MTQLSNVHDENVFQSDAWIEEFVHDYGDGFRVHKRGVNATPMVVRKFAIDPEEARAFTNEDGRKRAFTAFHFHPEFPLGARREYMERHRDGLDAAAKSDDRTREETAELRKRLQTQAVRFARSVAVAAHGILVFVAAHQPWAK